MNLVELSRRLAVAGVEHVHVKASSKPGKKSPSVAVAVAVVTASEDTLIGLWTGYSIIFRDSVHGPLETQTGIRTASSSEILFMVLWKLKLEYVERHRQRLCTMMKPEPTELSRIQAM